MASNSKLDFFEKCDLKAFKKNHPDVQFFSFPEKGVTVAIMPTGPSMGVFSLSIASASERKFRRKVGEYHAMVRMFNNQVLPVELCDDLKYIAGDIAAVVTNTR